MSFDNAAVKLANRLVQYYEPKGVDKSALYNPGKELAAKIIDEKTGGDASRFTNQVKREVWAELKQRVRDDNFKRDMRLFAGAAPDTAVALVRKPVKPAIAYTTINKREDHIISPGTSARGIYNVKDGGYVKAVGADLSGAIFYADSGSRVKIIGSSDCQVWGEPGAIIEVDNSNCTVLTQPPVTENDIGTIVEVNNASYVCRGNDDGAVCTTTAQTVQMEPIKAVAALELDGAEIVIPESPESSTVAQK